MLLAHELCLYIHKNNLNTGYGPSDHCMRDSTPERAESSFFP